MDESFLAAQAYPIMKEAAEFLLDYMVEDERGCLVTGPSISPENKFVLPNGERGNLCMGPAMDAQIAQTLFAACVEAAAVVRGNDAAEVGGDDVAGAGSDVTALDDVSDDAAFRARLAYALRRLPPIRVGKHGQIMEWREDYEEAEPGHRHISQLFALHPGELIDKHRTPELAAAARRTLERRLAHGGGHTGWSRAWIINFFARLGDGDTAYGHIRELLATSTYPNLLDCHPPFQIDGNFGATAGVAELLLQSHGGVIELLPALPAAWPDGEVTGLRARGAFGVDLAWRGGRLQQATVRAGSSGTCRIRSALPLRVCDDEGVAVECRCEGAIFEFAAHAGRVYRISPARGRGLS
jgi:alpha-L-fucosidase 2